MPSPYSEIDPSDLDVICEDGPVIAINKPSGVITQGAPHGVVGLVDLVKAYLARKYEKPGAVYLGVPHRLDRPVSGVVIFSRNSKCAARLSEQFHERQVKKVYRAVLERPPASDTGTLEDLIFRIEGEPRVEIVQEGHPGGKQARLHYKVIAKARGKTLVEVELETGRMHQIRIQFGSRGCPIVGDAQYGATTPFGAQTNEPRDRAIALHAYRLTLKHPVRYDDLTIEAPLPETWHPLGF